MKSVTLLFLLAAAIVFPGCKAGCEIEKVVTGGVAASVSKVLNCDHPDVVQKDILGALGHVNLCGTAQGAQGPIANMVCPLVASTVVQYIGNKIPESWGCHPAAAQTTLEMGISTACRLLPL